MRSRAGHAGRRCTLHRAMASHSRRRPSRARHRLCCDVLSARSGWTVRARLALAQGSALKTAAISCCLPSCASNQGFCPDDQRYLLSVGMPDLAKKGHRTQHHRHVAKIPVCLEAGGYLLLKALSPVATSPMILVHGSMGLRTTSCRNRLWAILNAGQLT